jgi:iron complex outermembrane receptor protein
MSASLKVYAGITPVSVGGDSIGGTIVAEYEGAGVRRARQGSLFKGEVGAFYRSNGNARGGNLRHFRHRFASASAMRAPTAEVRQLRRRRRLQECGRRHRPGRPYPAARRSRLDRLQSRNHTLGFAFKGGNHLFEAKVGYQDMPYQLYPNQRMDMLDNDQKRLNLRYLRASSTGAARGARLPREGRPLHGLR